MKSTDFLCLYLATILALCCGLKVDPGSSETKRRFLGNGIEILSGQGTRSSPFNKPAHDGHRALTNALNHRRLHQTKLVEALNQIERNNKPKHSRRLSSEELRQKALATKDERHLEDAVNSYINLDECWRIDELEDEPFGNVTWLHPCYNEQCQNRKSSEGCLELVYDFCCDPELEDCYPSSDMQYLRTQASCSAETCSRFMNDDNSYNTDYNSDVSECFFSNTTICDTVCTGNLWDMFESYVYGSCAWDSECFENVLWRYSPVSAEILDVFARISARAPSSNRRLMKKGVPLFQHLKGHSTFNPDLSGDRQNRLDRILSFAKSSVHDRQLNGESVEVFAKIFQGSRLVKPGGRSLSHEENLLSQCTNHTLSNIFDSFSQIDQMECTPFGNHSCETVMNCTHDLLKNIAAYNGFSTAGMTMFEIAGYDFVQYELYCLEAMANSTYSDLVEIWPADIEMPENESITFVSAFVNEIMSCEFEGDFYNSFDYDSKWGFTNCKPDILPLLFQAFSELDQENCSPMNSHYACSPALVNCTFDAVNKVATLQGINNGTLSGFDILLEYGEDSFVCLDAISYLENSTFLRDVWPEGYEMPSLEAIQFVSKFFRAILQCSDDEFNYFDDSYDTHYESDHGSGSNQSDMICTSDMLVQYVDAVEKTGMDSCLPTQKYCGDTLVCLEQVIITLNNGEEIVDENYGAVYGANCPIILIQYGMEWLNATWPTSVAFPSTATLATLTEISSQIGECLSEWDDSSDNYDTDNYDTDTGKEYDAIYDELVKYYSNFNCESSDLIQYLQNFEANGIRECIGEFNSTTCSRMEGCLGYVLELFSVNSPENLDESNGLFSCAARVAFSDDFDSIWPTSEQKPAQDVIDYATFLFRAFMNCEYYGYPMGGTTEENYDSTWDYSAECIVENQGVLDQCHEGCCDLFDRFVVYGNVSAFPTDSSLAGFKCGQMAIAGDSTDNILQCLRLECGSCYASGTGPYGRPGAEQKYSDTNPYNDECMAAVYDHCTTHPDEANCKRECPYSQCDTRKLDCPCEEDACQAYYNGSFAETQQCTALHDRVVLSYLRQGFLYPDSPWVRAYLEASSGITLSPPTGDFQLTEDLLSFADQVACPMLDQIVDCVNSTVQYCNSDRGFWSSACRELSSCGDGVLSWGEVCDDGNNFDFTDGCQSCQWVATDWYCPEPGMACEYCVKDPNMQSYRPARKGVSGRSEGESGCPFCMNRRLPDRTNPCLTEECKAVSDYPSAVACDEVVAEYCAALDQQGSHDPGCKAYENKSTFFAIPQITSCTYSTRSVNIEGDYLKSVKFVIVECPVTDPTGEGRDVTPMVPYWAPLYALSSDDASNLDPMTKKLLEVKALTEEDVLVPMTTLTDHETTPYDDAMIYKSNNGYNEPIAEWSNPFRSRVARLTVNNTRDYLPESCDWPDGEYDLNLLPPCDDSMATVARQGLKEMKWKGALREQWEFLDFADISTADLSKFTCNPKPNTIQFAVQVSTTRMEWVGGTEQEVERHEVNCDRYMRENDGQWPQNAETVCDTWESLFINGYMKASFGQRLYQQGCLNTDCSEQIAHCEMVPITKGRPQTNPELFATKSEVLLEAIRDVAAASSWQDVKKSLVSVSALAASTPIAGALDIFNSVTIHGTITKFKKDVRWYCPYSWGIWNETTWTYERNPDWVSDPCCNWELQDIMCCPIQDVPTGVVRTVTGFEEDKLDICQHPDLMKQTFTNLFTTMEDATKLANELSRKVDPGEFENVWEFIEECAELIYKSENINSDADCYCKYSKAQDGRCETSMKDMPKCYAECFREIYSEKNPYIVYYLKEQWNISEPISTDVEDENDRFANAWLEHMTEYGCEGEQSWHSDIGYAGFQWRCNDTCLEEMACDYQAGLRIYLSERYEETGEYIAEWQLNSDTEACESLGGERVCAYSYNDICYDYECLIPEVQERFPDTPCDGFSTCREECMGSCESEMACNATGGTWINGGTCCPPDAFVHTNEYSDYKDCKYYPPGSPSSWELRDEVCCSAYDGSWRMNMYGGECCLGAWAEYEWDGEVYSYCQDYVDTWTQCYECYQENCEPLMFECHECYSESEKCCGEEYVSQNETACLSYTSCNDRSIYNEEECVGDEPFCAWDGGWPSSQAARCEVQLWYTEGGYSQENCENLGFTWIDNNGWTYCGRELAANASSQDCFQFDLCERESWEKRFPGWEAPANGEWGGFECQPGCYINSTSSSVQSKEHYEWGYSGCTIVLDFPDEDRVMWFGGPWNEDQGWCMIHSWDLKNLVNEGLAADQEEACLNAGGELNDVAFYFEPSRYATEEQCDAGQCEGTINSWRRHPETGFYSGEQPWSEEQCLRLSSKQCDKWCPSCMYSDSNGACFHNETYEILYNTLQEVCEETEGYEWYSCPEPDIYLNDWYEVSTVCQAPNPEYPEAVTNQLSCWANFQRCSTEKCSLRGDCMNMYGGVMDFTTEHCTDPSWEYGDRFWGEEVVEENGYSYSSYVSCSWSQRDVIQGVCLGERSISEGCGYEKWYLWHSLGCKQEGIYTEEDCIAVNATWYEPIRNAESCSIPGCKLNRWDVRQYSEEDCIYCGGEVVNMGHWQGGNLMKPFVRQFSFKPNGRGMESVNKWIPRQAYYLVQEQLKNPVMRAFAQYKMQELLVRYNLYNKVLETISCDCSGTSSSESECFETQKGGALSTEQELPLGQTLSAGSGVTVVTSSIITEEARRRLVETNASFTSVSVTEYSAGIYSKHEPCQDEDASSFDAFAVINTGGLVVGQLIGNGRGLNITGAVESVLLCLPAREDITLREDVFDTYAVGKMDAEGIVRPVLFENDTSIYVERTASQICIEIAEGGVYYPIFRVADSLTTSTKTCSSCSSSSGTCVLGSDDTVQCICRCGFSGAACDAGCSFYCNDNGVCDDSTHVCTCNQGNTAALYTGSACGRMNCPMDSDGISCGGHGDCSIETGDAVCTCHVGWIGDACTSPDTNLTAGGELGYGSSLTEVENSNSFSFAVSSPTTSSPTADSGTSSTDSPTQVPTRAPTPAPTKPAPEPLVTFKVSMSQNILKAKNNTAAVSTALSNLKSSVSGSLPESVRDKVDIKITIKQTTTGSMSLDTSQAMDTNGLRYIKNAIAAQKCTGFATCNVTTWIETNRRERRRRSLSTASVGYSIEKSIEEDEVESGNTDDEVIEVSSLATLIEAEASAENVVFTASVNSVATPVQTSSLVIKAVPKESALQSIEEAESGEALDVSSVQMSLDASVIQSAVESSTELSVSAIEEDLCEGRTCSGHGECVEDTDAGTSTCECTGSWTGSQCEVGTSAPTPSPTSAPVTSSSSPTKAPTSPTAAPTAQPTSEPTAPVISDAAHIYQHPILYICAMLMALI